eukprot:3094782-Rhodomonas_salina.1
MSSRDFAPGLLTLAARGGRCGVDSRITWCRFEDNVQCDSRHVTPHPFARPELGEGVVINS